MTKGLEAKLTATQLLTRTRTREPHISHQRCRTRAPMMFLFAPLSVFFIACDFHALDF
jgi:hypothetical protein